MNDSNEKTLHIEPPRRVELALVAALVMLGLYLLVQTLGGLDGIGRSDTPPTNTITVSGMGKIQKAPDVARLTFTVMHEATTVAAAQEKVTAQANAVLDYLEDQDIEEKDVKTVSYTISPQYSYPNPCPPGSACPLYSDTRPKIIGYQVAQTVQVTVRDRDQVSTLIGGLGEHDVQNLYGPDFALDDPTEAQNEARQEAITEAKAQAKTLANQLGVSLGRIVSFNESGGRYPYPMYDAYGKGGATLEAAAAPTPQIPAGENEYTSYVTITYEIR